MVLSIIVDAHDRKYVCTWQDIVGTTDTMTPEVSWLPQLLPLCSLCLSELRPPFTRHGFLPIAF